MSCDRCSAYMSEDFEACKNAECTYHETFYAEQLKKELRDKDALIVELREIEDKVYRELAIGNTALAMHILERE